jgi:energy-coupling factor transporter ATP-binding protein EcfA2
MNFQSRQPLTPTELARRAAVLSANQPKPEGAESPEAYDHDNPFELSNTPDDERLYGSMAAQVLRDAKRSVALAAEDVKLEVFKQTAATLAEAVTGQWLPKFVMVDRLLDIPTAHSFFSCDRYDIHGIIAEYSANISAPASLAALPLPSQPLKRRLISHRASDLEPEKLVWVWPGRIPEGKLVLLGGPPGLGKSQLTAFMSAVVSNGGSWPCGEGSTLPGDVIFMSAEDGIQDTIIPRLMAAGADTTRVHIVAAATKPDGTGRKTFSLKTDVDLLEAKAKEIGCVRLIIVDPISAYMGGSDGNGNVETREVLEPLADMANRLKIAVVAVTHLNKGGAGGNQSALNRFAGSIVFVAAARAAFAVIEDPEDDGRRLLLQAKNNLGKKCEGLAFRLEQRMVADEIISSNVMFEGEHVSHSIDEALTASEARGGTDHRSGKDEAADFLRDILARGAVPVLEIEQEAREAGLLGPDSPISQNKSFRSARDMLEISPQRKGGAGAKGQWVWQLPATPKMPSKAYDAPLSEGGTLGILGPEGHLSGPEGLS